MRSSSDMCSYACKLLTPVCYNSLMNKKSILPVVSWALAVLVMALAGIVWADKRIDGRGLTGYGLFPLFGLGAFGIMWTHYVLGSLRRCMGLSKNENKTYYTASGVVVLFMILMHPGILMAQLYKDGFGLPPQSYLTAYVGSKLLILLGTISLIIFLLFECKRRFGGKPWWRYVEWIQIAAMVLVFIHGLGLGRELSVGWYRVVWYLYGFSLTMSVAYNYWYDSRQEGVDDAKI